MWKNHLIIAYRNLRKNKVFSIINIAGLAIAMAAGLLILKYVTFELSYDDFRKPSVYRVVDYAYRMDIHWWVLLLPLLLVFLVAFFTVTLQTVKTALENPVKSLRSE
ncbi:hypothetical protein [Cyclobacterium plantarum]|uniref:hypothetical protein n=1 Tax=Cyclobacterium plantarum TaxID=2716263 RepID=UPI003F6FFAEA